MTAIRGMPELVDAIRARRDELNISHETIDNIAGLQSGYTSKLLGPRPLKGFSHMSLGAVLGALGICLHVVDDPTARAAVQGRWQKRKRPQRLLPASIPASMPNEVPGKIAVTPELQAHLERQEHMKTIAKSGGKRRAAVLGKRARQRIASHAARMRWAKEKSPRTTVGG